MQYILASSNQGKIDEIKDTLGIDIQSLVDLGIEDDIEEFGVTFEQNALIKAQYVAKLFPEALVISDDSGLEVRALDYAPGVYSKRFSGAETNVYEENNKLLLAKMEGVEDRYARFRTTLCVYSATNDICMFFNGTVEGEIGHEIDGFGGFGYDPIFIYQGESFARLSLEAKNAVSHRGNALAKLKKSGVLNV
ncbi:RdgB/HAM1 family non-canonical purine NTP pyrophosphatase [Mollicutes bacterium LVI A0039]|nr:RdgB/HAM1 family non-canonical purine NTP pyrophosphatase [Mollicutes bacterium LVI A0039]